MMWLWIQSSSNKQRDDLDGSKVILFAQMTSPTCDKEINAVITDMPKYFLNHFKIAGHTVNQTAAKAINTERHYGNEAMVLVRSLTLCMLSHNSGQRFFATWLIEGDIKVRGAELIYLICPALTAAK